MWIQLASRYQDCSSRVDLFSGVIQYPNSMLRELMARGYCAKKAGWLIWVLCNMVHTGLPQFSFWQYQCINSLLLINWSPAVVLQVRTEFHGFWFANLWPHMDGHHGSGGVWLYFLSCFTCLGRLVYFTADCFSNGLVCGCTLGTLCSQVAVICAIMNFKVVLVPSYS